MLQACRSQGTTGTMGQEKPQSSNDSRLESALGRAFPSLAGSPGARTGAVRQGGNSAHGCGVMERYDRSRGLGSQCSYSCPFPGTGEGSYASLQRGVRTTGLGELPGCKYTLSSPQGLPCVITLCSVLRMSPHLDNQHLPKPKACLWLAIPNPGK